ncbi:MAG TPA: hotdog fold domain-containing protein [Nevskiaceae bacterium]|nr:hotdog fold domain-containing protein [Nevskiaceae bacterium]
MAQIPLALRMWRRLSGKPGGKWIFSKAICQKAPYFSTINPRFAELAPGYCEVRCTNRRAVHNHIGTFHAIAMCNMAEVAGGTMTEVTVPATHRWIPKGMTVEYLKKATTDLRAIAQLDPIPNFRGAADLPVTVNVYDARDQLVFRAVITMWVSPKR